MEREEDEHLKYEWRDFIPFSKGLDRYIQKNEENLSDEFYKRLDELVFYQSLIFTAIAGGAVLGAGYLAWPALEKLFKQ